MKSRLGKASPRVRKHRSELRQLPVSMNLRWLKQLLGLRVVEELPAPKELRFFDEQGGEAAELVKPRWKEVLAGYPEVVRAYLVRATPDGCQTVNVVLAIRHSGSHFDRRLVHALGDCFRSIFNKEVFVDIMFVSEQREAEIRAVCPPFYDATPTNSMSSAELPFS